MPKFEPIEKSTNGAPVDRGLAAAMRELADLLLATDSFHDLMDSIAGLAVRTIPGARTCGITMSSGGRVITVASADLLGSLLDEQQYDIDEGPCLEAMRTGVLIDAPDLSREQRWHQYPQRAMIHGISAVHSSPLIVKGEPIGVLNLYADHANALNGDRVELIAQLVTLTNVAITGALRNYGDLDLTGQLQAALSSRSVIDQAMGIIMGAQHCTATKAFSILRSASQTRNTRLAHVAQDLVTRTTSAAAS